MTLLNLAPSQRPVPVWHLLWTGNLWLLPVLPQVPRQGDVDGRKPFLGPTKSSWNKRLSISWPANKRQPQCNWFSNCFGTGHSANAPSRSMSGRPRFDRSLIDDCRPGFGASNAPR